MEKFRMRTWLPLVVVFCISGMGTAQAEYVDRQPIRTFGLGTLEAAAYSPDGRHLLTCGSAGACIWDVNTGKITCTFVGPTHHMRSAAFSADGRKVVTGGTDSKVNLWDASSGTCIRTFAGHTDDVVSVAFSPDGSTVLTGSWDDTARLWDTGTGACIRTFTGHAGAVYSVAFSPDGTKVLTGSSDHNAKLWDVSTGACIRTFYGHSLPVTSVAFSPDGTKMLLGSSDDTVTLLDAATGGCIRTFAVHVWSLAFSPDGTKVLTGDYFCHAKLWDAATGVCVSTLDGHIKTVLYVSFSPDGSKVMTASRDGTAKLWDAGTGVCIRTFTANGHTDYVVSVAFSLDGTKVLTGSWDQTAKVWDAATGAWTRTFAGHSNLVNSVVFSPDGTNALTGSSDDTAKLWDCGAGTCIRTCLANDRVNSVAFSPDGTKVLTGSSDDRAELWNAASGQFCIRAFSGHTDAISSVAFSADGKKVLTGSLDGTAKLWYVYGTLIRTFAGGQLGVYSAAISPDGTKVLTAEYNKAKLWDAANGTCLRTFSASSIASAAFSPDGSKVVTGGYVVKVWDVDTGVCTRSIMWRDAMNAAAFSPDGTKVLTGSSDCTAKLWWASGAMLTVASTPVAGITITGDKPGTTNYTAHCDDQQAVTLTAPAAAHVGGFWYDFLRWTGGADKVASITITMDADKTATAEYEISKHTLTVQSLPYPGVAITGDKPGTTPYTAMCDDQQAIALTASASAQIGGIWYDFLRWTGGADKVASITITMDSDKTATAEYGIRKHTLSVQSVPNTWVPIGGDKSGITNYSAQCDDQQSVTLRAPIAGRVGGVWYDFVRWRGGADKVASITITMDSDRTATAEYEIRKHTLTVQSLPYPGVAITGDKPGTANYTATCDDQQSITITAAASISIDGRNWQFQYWLVDAATKAPGVSALQVTMDAGHTATAIYGFSVSGDVNGDCRVNVLDLIQVRNRLGAKCSQ